MQISHFVGIVLFSSLISLLICNLSCTWGKCRPCVRTQIHPRETWAWMSGSGFQTKKLILSKKRNVIGILGYNSLNTQVGLIHQTQWGFHLHRYTENCICKDKLVSYPAWPKAKLDINIWFLAQLKSRSRRKRSKEKVKEHGWNEMKLRLHSCSYFLKVRLIKLSWLLCRYILDCTVSIFKQMLCCLQLAL